MNVRTRTVREPAAYRRRRKWGQREHPAMLAVRRVAARAKQHMRSAGRLMLMVLCVLALLAGVYLGGIAIAQPLLNSEDSILRADVMIVLGGDGPSRAAHAADLWQAGRARQVIVTGNGDCIYIASFLIANAVDPDAITIECRSGSTWQNAEFSAEILSRMKPASAIIVTNYFHERRALLSFRHFCPGMAFAPAPVPPRPFAETALGIYGQAIMKEYVKLAVYEIRTRLTSLFGNPRPAKGAVCIGTDHVR